MRNLADTTATLHLATLDSLLIRPDCDFSMTVEPSPAGVVVVLTERRNRKAFRALRMTFREALAEVLTQAVKFCLGLNEELDDVG